MKNKRKEYIIFGILFVIVILLIGYSYYSLRYNNVVDFEKSNAKLKLNMHIKFVDGKEIDWDETMSMESDTGFNLNSELSTQRFGFLAEQPQTGHIDVTFYEDKNLSKEWTENSSDYFTIDYSFKNEKVEGSKNKIVHITLIPRILKTNTTGVDIEDDVYVKITGQPYVEEVKEG